MEYYCQQQQQIHQQKQLTTSQQMGSMATGSSSNIDIATTTTIQTTTTSSATSSAATTTTAINNNNNNHSNNINNNINNNSSNNNNIIIAASSSSSSIDTISVDAATVAIAKDMLQLHHGGGSVGVILNNNNNNNTNNNNNNNNNNSNSNNNNSNNHATIINDTANSSNDRPTNASSSSSPPSTSSSNTPPTGGKIRPPENALAFLKYDQDVLFISETLTVVGRNSSTSHVHFHVNENNLVSRKHFQIIFDEETRDFYVQCLSKNGIFVDDFLHRRNADPLKLPARCFFRFPSTEIRIQFESFLHAHNINSMPLSGNSVVVGGIINNNNNNSSHHQQSSMFNNSNSGSVGGIIGNAGITGVTGSSTDGSNFIGRNNAHVVISTGINAVGNPNDHHQFAHHHHHQNQHQQHHSSNIIVGSSSSSSSASASAASTTSHLLSSMDSSNIMYSPLKISIPKKEQKSPYLSPTGTISAANSCPASPRQNYHSNQSNYNNYANNNIQNELFQTPSTASYNHNEKPPYSYAQLIVQAISAAPDKQLTLSGIYSFIVKHYPYYRKETNKGWQNSIRHNLSLNRYFIKVARSQDEPGKGSFWRIDPDSGAKLIDHSYKKRRQRSSQGFRPSYGMPRSAPVSPSHMDNSRESSPLQDIVLQSAPGSPGISIENRTAEGDIIYNPQNPQTAGNSQYNSGSPLYITNQQNSGQQQQVDGGGGGSGNAVGALIALKRNHAMAAGAAAAAAAAAASAGGGGGLSSSAQGQRQQQLHSDIGYDEMPADYSGNMESSNDECDSSSAKRPKYISEVL